MADITRGWDALAERTPPTGFLDACLRGVAQVVLQNNSLTSLLILAAIGWGASENGQPRVHLGG